MNILNKILECEKEYVKCFCNADEQQDFIRFTDDLIPDMWYQNYTWIKNADDDAAFLRLVESEIVYSKKSGKNFCLLRCHTPINRMILSNLPEEPEISVAGYYMFDNIYEVSNLNKVKESEVIRIHTSEMLEDLLKLDLEHDEESLGYDFCSRRVYRRKNLYLSDSALDSYIIYYKNEAVGSCDLFINNGVAKIEDFAISQKHQYKGFGTTLMKTMIEITSNKKATTIYLETDEEDTAKNMFQKCSFIKIDDFVDLSFSF